MWWFSIQIRTLRSLVHEETTNAVESAHLESSRPSSIGPSPPVSSLFYQTNQICPGLNYVMLVFCFFSLLHSVKIFQMANTWRLPCVVESIRKGLKSLFINLILIFLLYSIHDKGKTHAWHTDRFSQTCGYIMNSSECFWGATCLSCNYRLHAMSILIWYRYGIDMVRHLKDRTLVFPKAMAPGGPVSTF